MQVDVVLNQVNGVCNWVETFRNDGCFQFLKDADHMIKGIEIEDHVMRYSFKCACRRRGAFFLMDQKNLPII